jgi:hypothetical protein
MSTVASNRRTPHPGKTARANKDSIGILIDAELKDVSCCFRINLMLCYCCSSFNRERSYLYLRENSLESNVTFNCCCGCCLTPDWIGVTYFDSDPYVERCKMAPIPFCCMCYTEQPKLEIFEPGCMLCCMRVNLCGEKEMILMPFEKMPFPCCCCSNRVTCCDNYGGLCGPITGNPKVYYPFFPQPTDPDSFVQVAQSVMLGRGSAVSVAVSTENPVTAVAVPMVGKYN